MKNEQYRRVAGSFRYDDYEFIVKNGSKEYEPVRVTIDIENKKVIADITRKAGA